jgi:hypothetical protein
MAERRWTLAAAQEMFPDVRSRTDRAANEAEELVERREALAEGSAERVAVENRLQELVSGWAREMEALGLEVKGVWLVDFDTGSGYYCWKWPEEDLSYFHTYEEGFAGRTRIQ